ncbi:MAG: hypothetical protein IKX78_02090 [Clostridia bacterium]|nr:hypothetical protein [Clostridia bacterium]
MIFKREKSYKYTPAKKPLTGKRIALYAVIAAVLFVLGFFSAYPIMTLVGMFS